MGGYVYRFSVGVFAKESGLGGCVCFGGCISHGC